MIVKLKKNLHDGNFLESFFRLKGNCSFFRHWDLMNIFNLSHKKLTVPVQKGLMFFSQPLQLVLDASWGRNCIHTSTEAVGCEVGYSVCVSGIQCPYGSKTKTKQSEKCAGRVFLDGRSYQCFSWACLRRRIPVQRRCIPVSARFCAVAAWKSSSRKSSRMERSVCLVCHTEPYR